MLCVFAQSLAHPLPAQSLAHPLPAHREALLEPTTPYLDSIDSRATSLHVHGLKKGADDVPMVIIGSSGDCTSLSESPGDEWCTGTCKDNMETNPTCPTLCDCDAQSNAEQVDYDPIQAGEQEGDEAVDAAAAAVAAAAAAAVAAADAAAAAAAAATPPTAEAPTPPAAEAPTPAGAATPMVGTCCMGTGDRCRNLTGSAGNAWCTGTCKDSIETNPSCPTFCECADLRELHTQGTL